MENIYFETSAVNYLFDNVFNRPDYSSIKTKKLQKQKESYWYISNITLWEIFLTKNERRRYDLFDFSRCLFHDYLIPSPEEIIINHIKCDCPIIEKRYELKSFSLFAKEWTTACENLNYAFQPDRDQIEFRSKHFRSIGKNFIKTKKGYLLSSNKNFNTFSDKIDGAFIESIFNRLNILFSFRPTTDEEKYFISISLQVTMMILCYGIGFDQQIIENFWNQNRKTEPLERLDYIVQNYPDIFFRGPIANIVKVIILQSKNNIGRGVYFDSLHSIYTTYSDRYVSNDEHFLNFKKDNVLDSNMFKVTDVKDIEFFLP